MELKTDREILDALSAPFDPRTLSSRRVKGKNFIYIPVPYVLHRLNEVLGLNWEWKIVHESFYSWKDKEVVTVRGALTITLEDGEKVTRMADGGSALETGSMPGDALKAASSVALKKAALLFGVGAYLATDLDDAVDDTSDFNSGNRSNSSSSSSFSLSKPKTNVNAGGGKSLFKL